MSEVDVIVVGLGIGGERLAGPLLAGGLSVLAVERELIGGECNNWACVPTKMMMRAGDALAESGRVNSLAGTASARPDWSMVARRIRDEATHDWDDSTAVKSFVGDGGRFVRGQAVLAGPGQVHVNGEQWRASRAVVLATGSRPAIPPIDGLAGTPYWTNRDVARLETIPESVIILGGGAVGVELAQVLARFGAQVTLLEQADRLLAGEEPEASGVAVDALEADHVTVRAATSAARVAHAGGRFEVHLSDGETLTAQRLLVATGRRANLDGLGLESVGLDPDSSTVEVDGRLRAAELLWAIGDITDKGQFTHVATYQAGIAARDILGQQTPDADYRAVPRAVFTDPEIGAVGLTEAAARHQGLRVKVGTAEIATSARGWIHGPGNAGLVKLVVDTDRDVLVGATSAGPAGGEVLGMLTLAVRTATPISTLVDTIYAYPTFHRAIEDALRELSTGD